MDSPKNSCPHRQAVKPADQLILLPDFHRVGDAALMRLQVSLLHATGNPGAIGVGARLGAGLYDGGEVLIEGDAVALLAQQLGQAAGDMQLLGEQNGTRIG